MDYLVTWRPSQDLLRFHVNLKAIFSLGAGVDHIDFGIIPPSVAVIRMIDASLTARMVEYLVMMTLFLHRKLPVNLANQRNRIWDPFDVPRAQDLNIGFLGLGVLGQATARALQPFGYRFHCWTRNEKTIDGIHSYHGEDQLEPCLRASNIRIAILPLTEKTEGLLCKENLLKLPFGAALVNVGRGGHVVESDLIEVLDSRHLSFAILDILNSELLPITSPLCKHPGARITPHIASLPILRGAIDSVVGNIKRLLHGEEITDVVDRARGY